jgi:hypothetical protein
MGYSIIGRPGTEFGPCSPTIVDGQEYPCQHIDCAQLRAWAETICEICGEPIGYGEKMTRSDDHDDVVHFICLVEEVEGKRG